MRYAMIVSNTARMKTFYLNAYCRSVSVLLLGLILPTGCHLAPALAQDRVGSQITSPRKVTLTVTVQNEEDQFVTGLRSEQFKLFDGGVSREVEYLGAEDGPMSVGILLDTSRSMEVASRRENASRWLEIFRDGVGRFMALSHPANEYFLIAFSEQVRLLSDWTLEHKSILDRMSEPKPRGRTAFYDACYAALEKVASGSHKKRVLLLLSDGQDTAEQHDRKLEDVRRLLRETDVLVYSVTVAPIDGGSSEDMRGQDVLYELTSLSGGRSFFLILTGADVVHALESIGEELRHQYSVRFTAAAAESKAKWRQIKIHVTVPKGTARKFRPASVRYRSSYDPSSYQK